MFSKKEKTFGIIFTLIVIADLLCSHFDGLISYRLFTKPAIVVSLLWFFWSEKQVVSPSGFILTTLALIFSLFGDVLLLFEDKSPNYFIFGLVSFLLAHISYIVVFLKKRDPKKLPKMAFIAFFLIAFFLFSLLKDNLGEMLIPVVIYMFVIIMMVNLSFLRKEAVTNLSYKMVVFGAILFLISDSILALNKFYSPIPFASIFIMATYAFAQFFIVLGVKKQS